MSLKMFPRLRRTLAFHLTLWYAGIFSISSFLAFVVFYLLITAVMQDRRDQDLLNELEEVSSLLALKGMEEIKTALVLHSEAEGVDKIFFRTLNRSGEAVDTSNMSSWGEIGVNPALLKKLTFRTKHLFETITVPGHKHRVRVLYAMIGPGTTVQIGQSLEDDEHFIYVFRSTFGVIMLVLLFFAALTGWFMAKRALQGVGEVTRTARGISKGAFEKRVPVKARGYEIEQLANTFNSMLDRIHALVTGMREITDSVAHDLRSPITRIRGTAEMTLTAGKSMDEYEEMAANTIEECDRLLGIIDTMLHISEIEAGTAALEMEETDMAGLVRDACELFQPIAEEKPITITTNVPARCWVYGDIQSLQRMVANLLDNALKYTPSQGTVTVSVSGSESQVIISFNDTGIGISEEDLPKVFERFYRCDRSRSQAGVGLGLSLVRAIAKSHGGGVAATSIPGRGSTFNVTLPRRPPSN